MRNTFTSQRWMRWHGFHACIEYAVRTGYVDAVADVCNGASWLFCRYHLLKKAQHARPLYLLLTVSPRYLRRNNEYIKCAYLHDRYKLTDNYRIYHLRHTLWPYPRSIHSNICAYNRRRAIEKMLPSESKIRIISVISINSTKFLTYYPIFQLYFWFVIEMRLSLNYNFIIG